MGIERWLRSCPPAAVCPWAPVSPDCDGHVHLGIFLWPGLFQDSVKSGVFSAEGIQREAEGQEGQRLVSVGHWAGHCHQGWVGYIVFIVEEVGKGKKAIFLLILE